MFLPTVIVPIDSDVESLDACLAALDAALAPGNKVFLADAACSDPRIPALIKTWLAKTKLNARSVRREKSLAAAENCNRAFSEVGLDDVLLISSATRLTPGCLERIQDSAARDKNFASITPWSNNAEFCSYPQFIEAQPLPNRSALLELANAAAAQDVQGFTDLPMGLGFCLFVRRAAWAQLGGFDAHSFSGLDVAVSDWCLRASAMGWRHGLCMQAFVGHEQIPAGFSDGDDLERLAARWPSYQETLLRFLMKDPLHTAREQLRQTLERQRLAGPQGDLFGLPA